MSELVALAYHEELMAGQDLAANLAGGLLTVAGGALIFKGNLALASPLSIASRCGFRQSGVKNPSLLEDLMTTTQPANPVAREVENLKNAMSRARNTRSLLAVALIVFVIINAWGFYKLANDVYSPEYQEKLVAAATEKMEQRQDEVVTEVQTLFEDSAPVVSQAFYAQAKKDMPAFVDALDKERENFRANIESELTEVIKDSYEDAIGSYDKVLGEELAISDDKQLADRVVKNMSIALGNTVEKYYGNELTGQINAMYATWDDFPMAEGDDTEGLEDSLMGDLLLLLRLRLAQYEGDSSEEVTPQPIQRTPDDAAAGSAEKPADDAASEEKPDDDTASEDKPADDTASEDKPDDAGTAEDATDKPPADTGADDAAQDDNSATESSEDSAAEDASSEDKSDDAGSAGGTDEDAGTDEDPADEGADS